MTTANSSATAIPGTTHTFPRLSATASFFSPRATRQHSLRSRARCGRVVAPWPAGIPGRHYAIRGDSKPVEVRTAPVLIVYRHLRGPVNHPKATMRESGTSSVQLLADCGQMHVTNEKFLIGLVTGRCRRAKDQHPLHADPPPPPPPPPHPPPPPPLEVAFFPAPLPLRRQLQNLSRMIARAKWRTAPTCSEPKFAGPRLHASQHHGIIRILQREGSASCYPSSPLLFLFAVRFWKALFGRRQLADGMGNDRANFLRNLFTRNCAVNPGRPYDDRKREFRQEHGIDVRQRA